MITAKQASIINRAKYADLRVPPVAGSVCRLLPDAECAIPRGNSKYPFVWRFWNNRKGFAYWSTIVLRGDTGTVTLAQWWQDWFYENNTPAAIHYNAGQGQRPQVGWVDFKPWPVVKQITTCGYPGHDTFVVVDSIQGSRAYIQSYDNSRRPESYARDYLQAVGITYPDGTMTAPPCGPLYTFPIANHGKRLYVSVDDLSFLRML